MPDPSPIDLLEQRSKALGKLYNDTNALAGGGDDRSALMTELIREKAVVDKELAARKRIAALTDQAAHDPAPPRTDEEAYRDWYWRDQARRKDIAAQNAALAKIRNSAADLYGSGDVADPCLPCARAKVIGVASKRKVKPKPKIPNPLTKVEFLNGYDPSGNDRKDPVLAGSAKQWVNLEAYRTRLERERKPLPAWLGAFAEEKVLSVDRLSRRVRIRVEFQRAGIENFIVQLVPTGKNPYSATEMAASSSYKASDTKPDGSPYWLFGTTDADGKAVVEMSVRAAAGETWTLKARDYRGTEKTSGGSIETLRGLFVCTVTMDGISPVTMTAACDELKRQKILVERAELAPGDAGGKVPHQRFLHVDPDLASGRFNAGVEAAKASVKTVLENGRFKGTRPGDLAPYLIVSHFYDMSPSYAEGPIRQEVSTTLGTTWTLRSFLWDPTDTVRWFKSCRVEGDNGSGWRALPALSEQDFTIVGSDEAGYKQLRLNPPAAWRAEKKVRIEAWIRVISGGVNGYSSGDQGQANFVAICRRTLYADRDEGEMNQTIVHEIGHKVNFTTGPERTEKPPVDVNASTFRWLDSSPTHYIKRGHQGGHCYKDAVEYDTYGPGGVIVKPGGTVATALQPSFSNFDGRCVMFGAGGKGSKRPITFCANCTDRMLRLDIETGWPPL